MITELNERSREIFKYIVSSYLESGDPVGSRTISKQGLIKLSPASIRNTMADLEELGLLQSPHTSAGRIPTDLGLRLYVDGLMEVGRLSDEERSAIDSQCGVKGLSPEDMISQASSLLTNLSSCASLVVAPKQEDAVKQIQFVRLEPGKALIVMVMQNGLVENRLMEVPPDLPESAFITASNYLNAKLSGKTIASAEKDILSDIKSSTAKLDTLTQDLIRRGIALPHTSSSAGHIIVRGQSKLLEDVRAIEDLERARALLGYLDEQKNMLKLLDLVGNAQGVQLFIGTENQIFDQSGWSMVLAPYKNREQRIIGAIGVIGPTRLNYDRIIPMVDYTSQIITKLVDEM